MDIETIVLGIFAFGVGVFFLCLVIIGLSYLLRVTYDIVKEIWKNGVF